jgi:hypothetical protein
LPFFSQLPSHKAPPVLLPSSTNAKLKFKKVSYFTNEAFQYCDQAAKEKGKDQTADLNCMKWALTVQKDCWPCICEIAKKEGYKIKGCDTIMQIIEIAKQLREAGAI